MDTDMLVREMLAESGIDGEGTEELFEALVGLDRYVDDLPPEPSPELAALMVGLPCNVVKVPFSRRRSRMFLAGAVALGTVGAGGIAAAAEQLPDPAQSIVAEFSERYLPFTLPYPDGSREPNPEPTDPAEPSTTTVDTDSVEDGGQPAPPKDTVATVTVEDDSTAAPSATPSAQTSVTPSPSAVDPTPSAVPSPTTSGVPEGTEGTDPQAGEGTGSPSADESSNTEAGTEPTDPAGEPSDSSEPSPTANTRSEASDDPSPTPSPSTTSDASPTASVSPTVGWSDAP